MSKLQNFSVPFNIPIPGGMRSGKMVVVQGNIPSVSQRFAVNLLTNSGDIALHICPKFKENRVVRNNVLNMNWGPEESHGPMPVYPGQSFEIYVLCEPYSFKVGFNGHDFCDFSHRLPFNTISNLAVDGEVIVHNVSFKEPNLDMHNNNNVSKSVPYGFQPGPVSNNYNTGSLYPSVDSYPYPSIPSSPNSNVPQYSGADRTHYPYPSVPGYPRDSAYPQNPSLYPTQPDYPRVPHQGPYPQVPSSRSGGVSPSPQTKSGFLDQAGAALAGVLGPSLLAGGMSRMSGNSGYGKPNLLDEAGRALAGVMGGTGLAGAGKNARGGHSQPPAPQSRFLDQAGTTLAGILGNTGLMGATGRSQRGVTPTRQSQPRSVLDQAGSALAGIIGGSGLTGAGRSQRGVQPLTPMRHPQSRLLDQAGSALADLLGGGGLSGNRNNQQNRNFY